MPEVSEPRQFRQYPIELPLLHKARAPASNRAGVGWTRNLGEAGACVELAEILPPRGVFQARLQTGCGAIEAGAEVVWRAGVQIPWVRESSPVEGGVLYGLAFTQIAPNQVQLLRNVVSGREGNGHAGGHLPFEVTIACQLKNKVGPSLWGWTRDIGREGLSLCLPQTLACGTELLLTLHTPHEPLIVDGSIVGVELRERQTPNTPTRHQVRFTTLGWYASLYLALFLTVLS